MKTVLAYCYPQINRAIYDPAAYRFANSYRQFKDAVEHRLVVISNGRPPDRLTEAPFKGVDCDWLTHDNSGKDLGAFARAASGSPADLIIFLGAHVHLHRHGWLDRIVESYIEYGPGIYGAFAFHQPREHIRTTAWWTAPPIMNAYPLQPPPNHMRYECEHGANSYTRFALSLGLPAYLVTFKGVYAVPQWRHVEQDEALVFDQHSDRLNYK